MNAQLETTRETSQRPADDRKVEAPSTEPVSVVSMMCELWGR